MVGGDHAESTNLYSCKTGCSVGEARSKKEKQEAARGEKRTTKYTVREERPAYCEVERQNRNFQKKLKSRPKPKKQHTTGNRCAL